MKELFSNQVVINSEQQMIKDFLLNGSKLLNWNPSIMTIKQVSNDTFELTRAEGINKFEILKIESNFNRIKYRSTGGYLEYLIVIDLDRKLDQTIVTETFSIISNNRLPFTLIGPTMKRAFKHNLANLKMILERMRV